MVEGDIDAAYATIEAALAAVAGAVDALNLTHHEPRRIAYQGPLGRQRHLKLDIAVDELVLEADTIELLPRWPDLPEARAVRGYTLAEIAGEKLRCVMQRMQCRDLFDLWRLSAEAGVDPRDATDIFLCKAEHRHLNAEGFGASFRARLPQYRRRWTDELEVHVPGEVPHFDQVERAVSRWLRGVGLL